MINKFLYKLVNFLIPIDYFYYKNNVLVNISLIIYLLKFLLVGYFINSYIFENDIYCKKGNKIWINSKIVKNKLSFRIIKNIIYSDNDFLIILDEIKENIYNIDHNIEVVFLLNLFYKIKINQKSFINVNYYNCKSKLINLNDKTRLYDFFI